MSFLFVLFRSYSKLIERIILKLSTRRQNIMVCNSYLAYPSPNAGAYVDELRSSTGIDLNKISNDLKLEIKSMKLYELLSLHKFYNTVLDIRSATILFHEILRRLSNPISLLRPFGFRQFLVAHMLIGGVGIETVINKNSKMIVKLVGKCCSVSKKSSFGAFLKGKSVSLCGGAPSPRDNRADVKSADIVVRLNRTQNNFDDEDLVYYRSEFLDNLCENGGLHSLLEMPCWVSIKTVRHYFSLKGKSLFKKNRVVVSLTSDAAFDLGKLNAIPNVCFDLVYNGSEQIKIFDTDLNLSKMHNASHRVGSQSAIDFSTIFGEHPSYVQYCVLKYFSDSGYVSFEENPSFDVDWGYRKFIRRFISVYERT